MSVQKYLHVFSLTEPESFFLYYTDSNDITTSMIDCNNNFEFVRKNPCVSYVETIDITQPMMVDYHVKKYMQNYGIPYVRGGSYIDNELPEFQLASLHVEMITSSDIFQHNIAMRLTRILNTYTDDELCDDDFISKEQKKLLDDKIQMTEIKKKVEKYKAYVKDESLSHIEFLEDFIKYEIDKDDIVSKDTKAYYELTRKTLNNLIGGYVTLFPDREIENIHELTNPEFVFDYFFYHRKLLTNEAIWENKVEKAGEIIMSYKTIYYYLLNRMDEYVFDLATYYNEEEYAAILCFFNTFKTYCTKERESTLQLTRKIQIEVVPLD
jgi:hypothetical protein